MVDKKSSQKAKSKLDTVGEFQLPQISKEEMARFTIQEGLSEKERVKILLFKRDDPLQQAYVFTNARSIFRGNPDQIQHEIIPIILSNIRKWSEYVQVLAGDMFEVLLQESILEPSFLPELLTVALDMIKIWSQSVMLTWINVFMLLSPSSKQFETLIQEMSQKNQPESVRCGCLFLLAKQTQAGITFDAHKAAQNLLFDFNWTVRKTLATQLSNLQVDHAFFLSELLQDEEREVVQATGQAVADFILKGNASWVDKYFQLVRDRVLLPANVIDHLPQVLLFSQQKNSKLVLDVLSQLTANEENRLKCAGVIVKLYECFQADFSKQIYPFYSELVDKEVEQQGEALGVLAEQLCTLVFKVPECYIQIQQIFLSERQDVICKGLEQIAIQLNAFPGLEWQPLLPLLKFIIEKDQLFAKNWRSQKMYVLCLAGLIERCPQKAEAAFNKLQAQLKNSLTLPVKKQIADSLAQLVTTEFSNPRTREEINSLLQNACLAKSSQLRVVWVLFVKSVAQSVSARLFQEVYANGFLDFIQKELVLNLQLMCIEMVPSIRPLMTPDQRAKLDCRVRALGMQKQNQKSLQAVFTQIKTIMDAQEYQTLVLAKKQLDEQLELRDKSNFQKEQNNKTLVPKMDTKYSKSALLSLPSTTMVRAQSKGSARSTSSQSRPKVKVSSDKISRKI